MDINDQIIINGVVIHNRLVMPPMATGKARNGKITKEILDYYGSDKFSIYMSYGLSISSYMRDLSVEDFEFRDDECVHATGSYAFTINSKKMKFIKNDDEFTCDDQGMYIKISK